MYREVIGASVSFDLSVVADALKLAPLYLSRDVLFDAASVLDTRS